MKGTYIKYAATLSAMITLLSTLSLAQSRYTPEERAEIISYKGCFPQLSNQKPHKVNHDVGNGIVVSTMERTDFANERFLAYDNDLSNLNIGLTDKVGLRYSDNDIKAMLDDQFGTGPGFHINAHGITDNLGNSTGIQLNGKVIDAEQTANLIIQTLQDYNIVINAMETPFPIVLHTCNSAKGNNNSFAAKLSKLLSEKMANCTVVAGDAPILATVGEGYYEEHVIGRNKADKRPWKIFKNGKIHIGSESYKESMRQASNI